MVTCALLWELTGVSITAITHGSLTMCKWLRGLLACMSAGPDVLPKLLASHRQTKACNNNDGAYATRLMMSYKQGRPKCQVARHLSNVIVHLVSMSCSSWCQRALVE